MNIASIFAFAISLILAFLVGIAVGIFLTARVILSILNYCDR